jgi:hypothetical protein
MTLAQIFLILIIVESSGNDAAISSDGVHFGCLQIGEAYLQDANEFGQTDWTIDDMFDRAASRAVFMSYMKRWATEKHLGHPPTVEDVARMHYGGPYGWKHQSSEFYWARVERLIKESLIDQIDVNQ